jgi:hypothetical protein
MSDIQAKRPSTQSPSYQSRAKADCLMLGDIEDQVCWGIVRVSRHDCYLCEGHRAPPDYIDEPVAATDEELEEKRKVIDIAVKAEEEAKVAAIKEWGVPISEEDWLRGGWTAPKWGQYQANRWFRPFLKDLGGASHGMFWNNSILTDIMLTFLHSLVGEGLRCGPLHGEKLPPSVEDRLMGMGRQATVALVGRKVPFPDGCSDLKLAEPWVGPINPRDPKYTDPFGERLLAMPLHHLSNKEVQLLWGCAYIVADFSMLERGVRQCVMHVHSVLSDELDSRELPHDGLDELDW